MAACQIKDTIILQAYFNTEISFVKRMLQFVAFFIFRKKAWQIRSNMLCAPGCDLCDFVAKKQPRSAVRRNREAQ